MINVLLAHGQHHGDDVARFQVELGGKPDAFTEGEAVFGFYALDEFWVHLGMILLG